MADLVLFASAWIYREPIPEGKILLTVARGHGVTVSDGPAVAALVAAVGLVVAALVRRG